LLYLPLDKLLQSSSSLPEPGSSSSVDQYAPSNRPAVVPAPSAVVPQQSQADRNRTATPPAVPRDVMRDER